MLLVILKVKNLLEQFTKNNYKKTKHKEFWIEISVNYLSNGKVMIIHLVVGLTKKT